MVVGLPNKNTENKVKQIG